MRFIDFFDRIYIINLLERKDRLNETIQELKKINIDINDKKIEVFTAIKPKEALDFPNIGTRGCFESHLSILKIAQKQNLNNVLIIEDDIQFNINFTSVEEQIIEKLASIDWDFLYLGHREEQEEQADSFTIHKYSKSVMTTAFYAINSNIYDSLIDFLETLKQRPVGHPLGSPMHVDGAYSIFRKQNHQHISTWLVFPSLATQRSSASDINPNKFDQIFIVKNIVSFIRKLKRSLFT